MIQRNLDNNRGFMKAASVTALPLDWLDPLSTLDDLGAPFDIVLAADVVWVEDLIGPLVESIRLLCHAETVVILAHQTRSTRADEILFRKLDFHFAR